MGNFWDQFIKFCSIHYYALEITAILFVFIFTLKRIIAKMRWKVCIISEDSGSIFVSMRAIRCSIENSCQCVDKMLRSRIHIFEKKSLLCMSIHIKAPLQANTQHLSQQIREMVRFNLGEQFGFSRIGPVDVIVDGFYDMKKSCVLSRRSRKDMAQTETLIPLIGNGKNADHSSNDDRVI
jgi:hypothetical protein